MTIEYLAIGPVPSGEDCEQLGPNYNPAKAREECYRYIEQLRRQFGQEPAGAFLRVKSFPHDFGNYLEVICQFDPNDEDSVNYAFRCEGEAWQEWNDQS